MVRSHTAIYQDGMLKLQEPLELPEGSKVTVYVAVEQETSDIEIHRAMIRDALESLSRRATQKRLYPIRQISEERREELANLFAIGKPLSEIIMEEREGY